MEGLQEYRPHIRHVRPNLTECGLDWRSHRRWLPSPRYSDAPLPHIKDAKFPQSIRLLRSFPQANMVSKEEWMFHPGLSQRRSQTIHVEKPCSGQDSSATRRSTFHTNEAFMGRKKNSSLTCHAVIGARPYRSPEYSPGFHKSGSMLPPSSIETMSHFRADTFIPLQATTKTRVPYLEKRRLQVKQEEIQEVKHLEEWKPTVAILNTVLEELDTKAS